MINSGESALGAPSFAMAKKGRPATKPERVEEIPGQGDRLRLLRNAYGFANASAFATSLKIPVTTYNSFENGAPLSRQAAFKIVQRIPGISLDWLYFDNRDGLSLSALRRLGLIDEPGKRKS